MTSTLVLALLLGGQGFEQRISEYWDLLVSRDKAAALEYVVPESRNDFIRRREPVMLSWRLVAAEPLAEGRLRVRVEVQREIPGVKGVFPIEVSETWVRREDWQVIVPRVTARDLTPPPRTERPSVPSGRVDFRPSRLKIPFLHPQSVGSVHLANGLEQPLRVTAVEVDEEKFEVLEAPSEIRPGSRERFRLRYVGEELAKNLEAVCRVSLVSAGGQQTVLEIPVSYNYFSDGARGLFGLSKEEADQLRRGDPLRPAIETPAIRGAREEAERERTQLPAPPRSPASPPGGN